MDLGFPARVLLKYGGQEFRDRDLDLLAKALRQDHSRIGWVNTIPVLLVRPAILVTLESFDKVRGQAVLVQ